MLIHLDGDMTYNLAST